MFDPMSQSSAGVSRVSVPPLDPHPDDSPEEMIKQLEKKVNQLLEESADAGVKGDYQLVGTSIHCTTTICHCANHCMHTIVPVPLYHMPLYHCTTIYFFRH